MIRAFATTIKGLEELLSQELQDLGATDIVLASAGLEFSATMQVIYKINLYSRLVSRVMISLGHSGYRNYDDIYRLSHKIKWDLWFHSGNTIKVATTAIKSPLESLDFVTLKVKDGLCDYFNQKVDSRPSVDKQNPDIRIYTFLTENSITIYLDTSGEALFKRGYRVDKLEAPIRENLAYGLIKLAGWEKNQVLYDPMCGSGTIVIEAILAGCNIAPGLKREFAFFKFINFELQLWESIKMEAENAGDINTPLEIYASDINFKALSILTENLALYQLTNKVKIFKHDILTEKNPLINKAGVIVANPPYGVRLNDNDLEEFFLQLAHRLKVDYSGWRAYLISSDLKLGQKMHLKPSRRIPVYNGALECRLFEFKMVTGSNRKPQECYE